MSKLYRSLLWSGLVVAGVAACGDDVTVAPPPPPPAPTVHSISVAPSGVNVAPGSATTMVASVNADATVATTVTWSLPGVPASTASISAAGVLTVAAAAPNGPIAVQACSTVVPSVCGNATLTVSSVAATVTVVTVTPGPSIGFIVGQTPVTFTASVQGANNPPQTVTWSTASGTAAVISVNAVSGLVTIVASGTDVVKACSTVPGFTNVCGSSSVTVAAPAPTNITLLGITQGGTTIPVILSGVSGQVDVQLNVDPGAGTINKVQLLIGGVVAAEQTFAGPSAPAVKANGDPANLVQVITLSTNTAQIRKLANNLFVPAFFNGPNIFSAKLFITGNSTPVPSTNVIPVVLINRDALLSAPAFTMAPASTSPSASGTLSSGGATWFKGNVIFNGGNFVSFFPVSPASASWTATGGCSASANSTSGTPQTGITFSGTLTCGSTVEGLVGLGTLTLTPGTAPAADVIDLPYVGYSQVGTAYVVAGENRYNLLTGGVAPAPTGVFIDNKAPTITPNEIGFVAGCFVGNLTFPVPGCWINGSYNLTADFPAADAGSGVASVNTFSFTPAVTPVCTSSSLTPTSAAEDISPTKYNACAVATDNLGNTSTAFGTNAFGVDKTNPTITYAKDPAVVPALYAPPHTLAEAIPAMALDWKVNDNNSGLDTATALVVTNSHTTNGACSITVNAALNAEPAPGADRFIIPANVPAPDGGCATPGYYHWGANVTDRAGNNTADPVDHDFGFEPGVPTILALAPFPLYGGGTTTTVTVFASHTGASLSAAKMGIWYTSNAAGPVATPVQLIFDQGQIFNAPWATPLFLATPSAGTPLSVAAASSLAGIVIDSTQPPVSAFDSLSAVVRDVFDASNLTGALVHADTAVLVIPAPFIDPTKVSTSATVWANPNIGAATFSGSGACSFTYATPSNGPTIPSSVIVVRTVLANIYDVLFPITASPTLVSDNGTTRIYSYSVSGSTCASFGGTLKLIAVKNDSAGLPVGYLVP